MSAFENPSRQVKLWLQYIKMINIMMMSKSAERTGNWEGYLSVLRKMLPFLATAWHNHYTHLRDGFSKIRWNYKPQIQPYIQPYIKCFRKDTSLLDAATSIVLEYHQI